MDAQTIDRHSVNCYVCTELTDERHTQPADNYNGNDGGSICTLCQDYIDTGVKHALVAALWLMDEEEQAKDVKGATVYEFPEDSSGLETLRTEFAKFYQQNKALIEEDEIAPEQCGHDFWLTAQGHGVGFWDRGYKNGDTLTEACKGLNTEHLFVFINDDGTPDFG
jgi:hypothetical protein